MRPTPIADCNSRSPHSDSHGSKSVNFLLRIHTFTQTSKTEEREKKNEEEFAVRFHF